jgi:alkanesulfonate monooxygenase
MSENLRFNWYAPTHGDARIIGGRDPDLAWTPAYIDRVAQEAEHAGFEGILLPVGPTCADPFISAAHIAAATERLRVIPAVRTGAVLPTIAAKSLATLCHLAPERIALNVVTGGSPMELAMDGDTLPHDARYRRTAEFLQILLRGWEGTSFDFDGEFFKVVGARFAPQPVPVPVYLGGASEYAVHAAARYADTYLMWGEPVEAVARQFAKVRSLAGRTGRRVRCGMRINLIVGETHHDAWRMAEAGLAAVTGAQAARAAAYIQDSDSEGQRRIQQTPAGPTGDRGAYWTGMVRFRSGNSTALVGNPEEVAAALGSYVRAGAEDFILSSYPHHESVRLIGAEVLPRLRKDLDQNQKGWKK